MSIKQNLVFYGELSTQDIAKILQKERNFCTKCRAKISTFKVEVDKFGLLCKCLCINCRQKILPLTKMASAAANRGDGDSNTNIFKSNRFIYDESDTDNEKSILHRSITPNSDIFSEPDFSCKESNRVFCENTVNFSLKVSENSHDNPNNVNNSALSKRTLRSLRSRPHRKEEQNAQLAETSAARSKSFVEQVFVVIGTDKKDSGSSENPSARFGCEKTAHIFDILTEKNINWCKYCGTTQGVNWRPGPWGPKTLCNRHGCDFMGYGFAANKPKLDLSSFYGEPLSLRKVPVIKEFCFECITKNATVANPIIMCHGCPRSFHVNCYNGNEISGDVINSKRPWFCEECCVESFETLHVFVELPKGVPYGINSKSPIKEAGMKRETTIRHKPESASTRSSPKKRNFEVKKPAVADQQACTFKVFDYDVLERHASNTSVIEIPKWTFYEKPGAFEPPYSQPTQISENSPEDISDEAYIKRHKKYENLEKNNKLFIIK